MEGGRAAPSWIARSGFRSRRGRRAARDILNDREGVWRCRTIFNCTEACPREIRITKAIGEVKKAILKGSARAEPIRHAAASGA